MYHQTALEINSTTHQHKTPKKSSLQLHYLGWEFRFHIIQIFFVLSLINFQANFQQSFDYVYYQHKHKMRYNSN